MVQNAYYFAFNIDLPLVAAELKMLKLTLKYKQKKTYLNEKKIKSLKTIS